MEVVKVKNTNICPKCNSGNVIKAQDNGYNAMGIPLTLMHVAKVCRYVCCNCGFAEEWVEDKSNLEKIETKYR